jgi:hypothetical protein
MIAYNIGKTFLKAYNEKFNESYSPKDFFIEKYFSLFFDHEKYMQWVTNSPFVQGLKKGVAPTAGERKEKLSTLIDKISNNQADASIAIGFPSLDLTATTSGQITDIELPLREDDVYLSWIGGGFGIGVQSGLSLFFDNPEILLNLYDGWGHYRNYLNTTPQLRGNQINTWNGQWIAHRYEKDNYDPRKPLASFSPFETLKNGTMEIKTIAWTDVILGLAREYPESQMTSYIYSLGKTNTTIGFIPFNLPKIRYPYDLYIKYFDTENLDIVKQLYGTAIGFTKICQMGAIGIKAMEPKGFRDCLEKGAIPKYDNKNKEKQINFNTYKTWLLAMLNNEQLWEKAEKIASTLNDHSLSGKDAKKDKSQEVTNLLKSVNRKQFIDNLTPIVTSSNENTEQLREIAILINSMPIDNVPYFLSLIKFNYAVINKK